MDILVYLSRVLIIFLFTYFATRILSKKAIAEMTAYELAGIILLTTVASEPLVVKVTTKAIFGVGFLAFLIWGFARLSLLDKLTPILEHTPSILVKDGQVDMDGLKSANLSLNQLKGLLRQKGYDKVADVEYALLEPQGKLSAIPKSQKRPLHPGDINISTEYEGLTLPLIMDGFIIQRNLKHASLTTGWLLGELARQGIKDYREEVNLAELDTSGKLSISRNSP